MKQGSAVILRADALKVPLPDESVDLIITSPPYFALRSYTDGGGHYEGQLGSEPTPQLFLEALWAATAEMMRVLKPSGSIFVNLGDKYAGSGAPGTTTQLTPADTRVQGERSQIVGGYNKNADFDGGSVRAKSLMGLPWRYALGCIDRLGLILRAEIVWDKPNGLPESVGDRVRRSHEQWFHFTKEPSYFAAVDEIRVPHTGGSNYGRTDGQGSPWHDKIVEHGDRGGTMPATNPDLFNPLGKLPGSVWTIASEPLKVPAELGIDHFAAFPTEWPRRIILGWSPSGICVECGHARHPNVEKQLSEQRKKRGRTAGRRTLAEGNGEGHGMCAASAPSGSTEARITGYSCACPEPIADTRPAVVLDPFGGTGTVALVAKALGRVGISVDLSSDYCRLARWRTTESGHGRKALAKTWSERQTSMVTEGAA